MLIKSISCVITDACNLQCQHCDIWQSPAKMISTQIIEKLLSDPVIKDSYHHYGKELDISLGGGEPFVHPSLQKIVTQIENEYPGSLKTITTNGTLTRKILNFLKNNPELEFKLNISVDGINETHDKIRGIQGSFDKTIKTIRILKHSFPKQRIEMKMTIMRDNYPEILDVYRLSQRLGCSFSSKPVEQMTYYTNRNSKISTSFKKDELHSIKKQLFFIAEEMLQNNNHKMARFIKDIPFHLAGEKRHFSCSVLWEHITIMSNGDIFFCIKEKLAGNILNNSLSTIETKPKDFKCTSCMLMCGSFKDYDDNPAKKENFQNNEI